MWFGARWAWLVPHVLGGRTHATYRTKSWCGVDEIRSAKTAHRYRLRVCWLCSSGRRSLPECVCFVQRCVSKGLETGNGLIWRDCARIGSLNWVLDPAGPGIGSRQGPPTSSTLNAAKRVHFGSRPRKNAWCACCLRSFWLVLPRFHSSWSFRVTSCAGAGPQAKFALQACSKRPVKRTKWSLLCTCWPGERQAPFLPFGHNTGTKCPIRLNKFDK